MYGVTEVFVKHDYYANLRVKIIKREGNALFLCEYKGDKIEVKEEIKTDKKIYPIPDNFLQIDLDKSFGYIYEHGDYSFFRYKYIKHTGSSRSSKSWSIIESAVRKCEENPNFRFTVWRDTQKSLGDTIWKDLRLIFPLSKREYSFTKNTQDIYFKNGSTLEPHGDDTTNAHGLTQNIAWLNEPYRMSSDTFNQIDIRSEQIWIDMNPIGRHWTDELEKNPRCKVIHSTFEQNPFCPKEMRLKILSYNPDNPINIRNGTADAYRWSVYGLGLKAEKPNKVYNGWESISDEDFDLLPYPSYFGLDFGSNSPTAVVEVKYNDNCFFVKERFYTPISKLPPGVSLGQALELDGIPKDRIILADSADNSTYGIADLAKYGFWIKPAKKGQGSVATGISFIQSKKVFVCKNSVNLYFEESQYEWEEYKGVLMDFVIKKDDHLIDAFRYIATYLQFHLNIK
jgi:phage terminase large subunit